MNYLLQGRATSLDLLFPVPFSTLVLMQFVLPRPVFLLSFFLSLPSAGFAFPEVLAFFQNLHVLFFFFSSPPQHTSPVCVCIYMYC